MRLLKGRVYKSEADEPQVGEGSDDRRRIGAETEDPEAPAPGRPSGRRWGRRTTMVSVNVPEHSVRRTATIESRPVERSSPWARVTLGGLVAIASGAALAVVGCVALLRAGIDSTWFRPRVHVIEADHTALLGALEIGAGLLLLLAGLTGSRVLVTILGLAMAVASASVAVEPAEVQRELAIESWWAWTLAAVGAALVLAALHVPRERRPTVVDVA